MLSDSDLPSLSASELSLWHSTRLQLLSLNRRGLSPAPPRSAVESLDAAFASCALPRPRGAFLALSEQLMSLSAALSRADAAALLERSAAHFARVAALSAAFPGAAPPADSLSAALLSAQAALRRGAPLPRVAARLQHSAGASLPIVRSLLSRCGTPSTDFLSSTPSECAHLRSVLETLDIASSCARSLARLQRLSAARAAAV